MGESHLSLEKMNYSSFQRHFAVFRQSDIPNKLIDLGDANLQLPDRSSLHTMRNFLTYTTGADDIFPDEGNPFYAHEEYRKFLHIESSLAHDDSRPYPVTDRLTYMPGKYRGLIQHFFSQNKTFYRTLDDASVDKTKNVLACHEYAPLFSMRLQGNMVSYRKFEIVFRTLLDCILSTQFSRHHYIQIPLSDILYTRADFMRTVLSIKPTTLKGNEDPSYYFLIHLIGFLFNEVSHENEVAVLPNDEGYIKSDEESIAKTNSLFNRIPHEQLDTINIILTHADRAIIYNLGDLRAFTTTVGYVDMVLRHINTLKACTLSDHPHEELVAMTPQTFATVVSKVQGNPEVKASDDGPQASLVESESNPQPAPQDNTTETIETKVTPLKPQAPVVSKPVTVSINPEATFHRDVAENLQRTVDQAVAQTTSSPQAPIKRADTLKEKHLNIKIGTKTIAEHLATPDPSLSQNTLDFMESALPDKTMAHSTIAQYDQTYVKHMLHKDMAKTLTSFMRQGYFVTDLKETLQVDKFSRLANYKVKMVDVTGKSHTLNFTFPAIDENGFLYVNGVKSRMVKQNINLPICKVSEDRVNLSSNYNKTLVERTRTRANSFGVWINKYLTILQKNGSLDVHYGRLDVGERILPYEYTQIAQKYTGLIFDKFSITLDYDNRFAGLKDDVVKKLQSMEPQNGTYCGTGPDQSILFWDMKDVIHQIKDNKVLYSFHFMALMHHLYAETIPTPSMLSEWCELKILDLSLPIILVLGFQYGLKNTLDYIHLPYEFIPTGKRISLRPDQIRIKFSDGSIIFSRYPFAKSLVASGLAKWDLSKYAFDEFNAPDIYYVLLSDRGISQNYLRGVASFFDFFIDPITFDVLKEIHEPTNVRDLLLRAVEMLSTVDHRQASAMHNHRMRGYERLSSTLYNQVARGLATYKEKRNQTNGFSLHPDAVFMQVMSDPTIHTTETLNPVHEMKGNTQITYSGSGGRTSQSFVVNDRVYPKDGVGILSESTVDSGKVAMTAYTSANPRIESVRGRLQANDGTPLDPTQILSVGSLLMPGAAQDDRLN